MIKTILFILGTIIYLLAAFYTVNQLKPDSSDPIDTIAVAVLATFWPITWMAKVLTEKNDK